MYVTGIEVGGLATGVAWCEREERSRGFWWLPTPALMDDAMADADVDRVGVIDGIDSEAVRSVGSNWCSAQGASSSEMAIGVACCMREERSYGAWR